MGTKGKVDPPAKASYARLSAAASVQPYTLRSVHLLGTRCLRICCADLKPRGSPLKSNIRSFGKRHESLSVLRFVAADPMPWEATKHVAIVGTKVCEKERFPLMNKTRPLQWQGNE